MRGRYLSIYKNRLDRKNSGRMMARQGCKLGDATAGSIQAADIFQHILHGQASTDIQCILPPSLVTEHTDSSLLESPLQDYRAGLAKSHSKLKIYTSNGHFEFVATVYRLMVLSVKEIPESWGRNKVIKMARVSFLCSRRADSRMLNVCWF